MHRIEEHSEAVGNDIRSVVARCTDKDRCRLETIQNLEDCFNKSDSFTCTGPNFLVNLVDTSTVVDLRSENNERNGSNRQPDDSGDGL